MRFETDDGLRYGVILEDLRARDRQGDPRPGAIEMPIEHKTKPARSAVGSSSPPPARPSTPTRRSPRAGKPASLDPAGVRPAPPPHQSDPRRTGIRYGPPGV